MSIYWSIPLVALLSLGGTWAVRQYALSRHLMDIPNERSSHKDPTPRGGGVAIVFSFLSVLPFLAWGDWIGWSLVWALLGSGGVVALIGFLDDHGHIAARWRLLAHFGGAAWALIWLGGMPPIYIHGVSFYQGWIGHIAALIYLVWTLNLYNFMDGIDGIAACEAVTVCIGGSLLYVMSGAFFLALVPLLLAGAVLGFLFWNFPPAKIFMGDAGSGFLGIVLGILSIQSAWVDVHFIWGWLILLAVFFTDATFTLIRRVINGEKPYEAHRSHAYQYASRLHGGHLPVTLMVLVINIFWLLPLALMVGVGLLNELVGLLLAYLPIIYLCAKYGAGAKEVVG